jgi:orotate phosphoribosyltransferase
MTDAELLKIYEETGGLLKGHFLLTSGLHSDTYLQSALVLQHPKHAERIGRALAGQFPDANAQFVAGPALGGILVAYEVARALGVRALFTEREEGVMRLRRGFQVEPGERFLVTEDVITTGGSTREVIKALEDLGGECAGVCALIDRSGGAATFSVKMVTLARLAVPTWKPEDCPLCASGQPAVKPGSRARKG